MTGLGSGPRTRYAGCLEITDNTACLFRGRRVAKSEAVGGVIHGKTIELEMDPGLQDGERVEVVIRRVGPSKGGDNGIKATAGALAHLPPENLEDLEAIVRDLQQWPFREAGE